MSNEINTVKPSANTSLTNTNYCRRDLPPHANPTLRIRNGFYILHVKYDSSLMLFMQSYVYNFSINILCS